MNSFLSPLLAIIARRFSQVAGALLSVLIILTVYDEDVITVEHILTLLTALGASIALSRAFLPDSEPNRWTPAELDAAVIAHIHYRPHGYPAHTLQAQKGMGNIFVYKTTAIVEELLSPLITPYILIRHLRPRALEIIDFFRTYTLELADIGDVCSFSQFNFQQNGHRIFTDPLLLTSETQRARPEQGANGLSATSTSGQNKAELLPDERHTTRNGKLELSLIHFKLMNPSWQPADNGQAQFIDRFTRQSKDDPNFPVLASTAGGGGAFAPINEASAMANSQSTIDYAFGLPPESTSATNGAQSSLAIEQAPPALLPSVLKTSHHQQQQGGGGGGGPSSSLHHSLERSISGGRNVAGSGLLDSSDFGYHQKRRRLLQLRMNSMFSEAEERETEMSLSSLYFHQMVADNVGEDAAGGGEGFHGPPQGTSVSFTAAAGGDHQGSSQHQQRSQSQHHRTSQRPISESIPLLHPSSQEPRP